MISIWPFYFLFGDYCWIVSYNFHSVWESSLNTFFDVNIEQSPLCPMAYIYNISNIGRHAIGFLKFRIVDFISIVFDSNLNCSFSWLYKIWVFVMAFNSYFMYIETELNTVAETLIQYSVFTFNNNCMFVIYVHRSSFRTSEILHKYW